MSQNPYANTSFGDSAGMQPAPTEGNPLQVPGMILLVISVLGLAYSILNLFVTLPNGPPAPPAGQPPEFEMGQKIGFYGAVVLLPIFSVVCLIGSICMVRLKGYGLAMTGAIMGLVPVCGPCLVLAIPFSLWALVLLAKPEVKARFS